MSGIPPTIEDDGESDYEQEPLGIGGPVTYDEDISKPLDAPANLVWRPMGTDTDPLVFLPGGHREYLLPLPNRGDSVAGALPPEYGSKWSNPGHLFRKQVDSHLEGPMFKDDHLTLNDEGLEVIKAACEEMQQLVDLGFTSAKQLTDGRLMLLKDQMEELSKKRPSVPGEDATYESRLHEILAQSWQFALRKDGDLSKLTAEDIPPIPTHSTADLHHLEFEYASLDKEGWPGSNRYIQEHARIRLKHSRLTKAEENACINMLAVEKARNDNMGPPLKPKPTSTDEPCWKAPTTKRHHRKYDEWTKEVAPLYLVPHINLQDLGTPDRLMQFITNRASVSPIHFLQQDFRSTYLGRALRILTGPFSMHEASWLVDAESLKDTSTNTTVRYHEYALSEWERFRCCEIERNSLPVGDLWLGLKAQVITYRFYHRLCLFLLRAAGIKQAKPKPDISLFPGLAKGQKDENARDIEDAKRYLAETRDETGTGLLFSTSFESYPSRIRNKGPEAALRGHFEDKFRAAIDHLDYLITTPEYFHCQIQEAYEQHYTHLFPGLITGEDMKKELFVDVLRDVFRRALVDLELCGYLAEAPYGMGRSIHEGDELLARNVEEFRRGLLSQSEYDQNFERVVAARALHFYAVKYRGMIACMHYVSMITNRGIVPASKNMRKYYKRDPRFKAGLGKGNWVSGSGVVRYLPKRGSEGRVMKRTRKLRRTILNFPGLEFELSKEGKAAVRTDETIRSIHMLLVEFLGQEELINAIGLGKLLRRIGALADKIRSDDEHCRFIRKPLDDLIQKMSAVFVTIEQADTTMPYLANPVSSDPDEHPNLAKLREYFIRTEWTHAFPGTTKQFLEKLDEFPIETRVKDEVISALFRQHQRWMMRQGPVDNAQDPDQTPKGLGSRKTATLLWKFWAVLYIYLLNEKRLGDGRSSKPTDEDFADLPPGGIYSSLVHAWTTLTGRGRTPLKRLNFLGKWATRGDLYSHIRQPGYETFRKSLMPLTLERFLEHISESIHDDRAIDSEKADEIRKEVSLIVARIRRFKAEEPDVGLSSSFAAEAREAEERWLLKHKDHFSLLPRELGIAIDSNKIGLSDLANAAFGELPESDDEEEGQGPGWAVGIGGEVGEEDVDMDDSSSMEDPVVEDDSEEEDAEMRDKTVGEEPMMGKEADDVAIGDDAKAKDNMEAVDEGIRGMRVDGQPEPEPAPGPALEPAPEPAPEPVPEPAPQPAPGTPPHTPGSKSSTPSPERHKREAAQELENARYAWLENLDEEAWREVQKKHGGFVDDKTSGRRTKREVPKKERELYLQKTKSRDVPPEEAQPPKKGVLRRSVFDTIESIYRPTSGFRSPVTLEGMQEFMRAIGFPVRRADGLMVRYTYDRAAGLIPHGRLARETFLIHQPHGSWGQRYEPQALDNMKKALLGAGVTYELITEFYEERGAS